MNGFGRVTFAVEAVALAGLITLGVWFTERAFNSSPELFISSCSGSWLMHPGERPDVWRGVIGSYLVSPWIITLFSFAVIASHRRSRYAAALEVLAFVIAFVFAWTVWGMAPGFATGTLCLVAAVTMLLRVCAGCPKRAC